MKYRKFWVSLTGTILIALDQFFDISLALNAETVVTVVISLLTAFGVLTISNETQ